MFGKCMASAMDIFSRMETIASFKQSCMVVFVDDDDEEEEDTIESCTATAVTTGCWSIISRSGGGGVLVLLVVVLLLLEQDGSHRNVVWTMVCTNCTKVVLSAAKSVSDATFTNAAVVASEEIWSPTNPCVVVRPATL